MISQHDTAENQTGRGNIIPEIRSNQTKTWIYRTACILLFADGIVYFLSLLIKSGYIKVLLLSMHHNTDLLFMSVAAAMVIVLVCFIRTLTKIPVTKFVALIIAGIVLAGGWYIYFRYLPKYGPLEACAVVKADPKYASSTIEPHYRLYSQVEDNPFCDTGYILNVVSDGEVAEWIEFDSATGKYESCVPDY